MENASAAAAAAETEGQGSGSSRGGGPVLEDSDKRVASAPPLPPNLEYTSLFPPRSTKFPDNAEENIGPEGWKERNRDSNERRKYKKEEKESQPEDVKQRSPRPKNKGSKKNRE